MNVGVGIMDVVIEQCGMILLEIAKNEIFIIRKTIFNSQTLEVGNSFICLTPLQPDKASVEDRQRAIGRRWWD